MISSRDTEAFLEIKDVLRGERWLLKRCLGLSFRKVAVAAQCLPSSMPDGARPRAFSAAQRMSWKTLLRTRNASTRAMLKFSEARASDTL
jgi:hypothetical protein